MTKTFVALTILATLLLMGAAPAMAQEATQTPAPTDDQPPTPLLFRDDTNICLCQKLLARTLCKQPQDFSFIDEYRNSSTYSFTVFYANKETRFMCMVTSGEVRIKGKAWQPIMRTIPLDMDMENACAIADYSVPECPEAKPVVCCGQKTTQDISEDKAYDFWSRPIPEILDEELRRDQEPPQEATPEPAAN